MDETDNLDELVDLIFSTEPKPKDSIQIGLDDSTADLQNENRDIIFEILSQIFLRGIEKKYKTKSVVGLTKEQYNNLNEYFSAINYKAFVYVNYSKVDPWDAYASGTPIYSYQMFFKKL